MGRTCLGLAGCSTRLSPVDPPEGGGAYTASVGSSISNSVHHHTELWREDQIMYRVRFVNALALVAAISLFVVGLVPVTLWASSHREAPLISKDAYADNTDTYVWIPRGQTTRMAL